MNTRDKNGFSPLIWAAHRGCNQCAEILIDAGADVNIQNEDGNTSLMCAAQEGHSICFKNSHFSRSRFELCE